MPTSIEYSGDWTEFGKFLEGHWRISLGKRIDKVTGRAAEMIRAEIVNRIKDKEYESNALMTAIKKGFSGPDQSTPLIHTGRLIREGLLTDKVAHWVWKVGIIADLPASGGNGLSLFDIVPILHDGATIKQGNRTVRIPPRPFLSNVFEDPKIIAKVQKMWEAEIKIIFKKYGKL